MSPSRCLWHCRRPRAQSLARSLPLSRRELEVLSLAAQGLNNAEIARHLVVSIRTVHAHLRSIYRKLDVHSRTAAAAALLSRPTAVS